MLAKTDAKFGPYKLTILHTNDTHANLDNIAKRVTGVKAEKAKNPNALLLDAGDVFQGTLYFNEFHGQADLKFMNLMGYDAMTFGNHEFDLGATPEGHQALVDFIKGAQFPFVSSNIDFSGDEKFTGLFSDLISSEPEKGKIYNGIIKEINGEKVGIFGLTTAETVDISSPGAVKFEEYLAEAERAVKAFEGRGVNKIIALTHIGYDDNANVDNDLTLATKVDGIDVIVGGHSHTTLSTPVVVDKDENGAKKDPTVIVQTGANNTNLGVLDVKFSKNGVIKESEGKLIPVANLKPDKEAEELLKPYASKIKEVSEKEIGVTLEKALENPRLGEGQSSGISVRNHETILGNIITDGMLAKAKEYNPNTVMALQNGGGIRAAIEAGPVTNGEVIKVLPFGNTLAVMDLTGADLKAAFEVGLRSYPGENGGFLHVAGGKVEFDSTKPVGQRVVNVYIKNAEGAYTPVVDNQTYTIATNAFTAQGGDGFDVFAKIYKAGKVTDLGLSDWENFRDHLVSLDKIPTELEGRIVDVAEGK
ncbi:5'-nucleotidase C-terminal domain-containing protein [Caldifermentibacillus hisashii]|uniref:bifunctional metallophosphatase/5'-nucleotidase n=1 Tax=Caldifermentibacillus hisashii TaxID=996558 RepID=UPI003D22E45E